MSNPKGEEDAENKLPLKKGVDEIFNPESAATSPPDEENRSPIQSDSKGNDLQSSPSEEELAAESIVKNDTEEVSVATKTTDAEPGGNVSVSDESMKDSKHEIETEHEAASVSEKSESEPVPSKPEETAVIAFEVDSAPLTPALGKITDESIEVLHSIGDIHGWAPGLISYLIKNKLAEIEINGFSLQNEDGSLNVTFSLGLIDSSIETLTCFFISEIKLWTNFSGADAPDVKPILLHEIISLTGIFFLKSTSSALLHPAFFATSTNLFEFEELSLPITKNMSHKGDISLTAFCLFVVA